MEHPDIDWTSGEPVSTRFGDIYAARGEGLAESRVVFLAGCNLPQAWQGRAHFTVGELGFGTGANILALWDLWLQTRQPGQHLHVFTVEKYPLSLEQAERAHEGLPELHDLAAKLRSQWPPQADGFHRLNFPQDGLTIDIAHTDVRDALTQWQGKADAWFLDGFAPAKNPDMWAEDVMALIAQRSNPGARLGTFTVAGAVRRGLAAAGFRVEKRPGFGRKRENLAASLPGIHESATLPKTALVIGAGIAGAWTAHTLRVQGLTVSVIDIAPEGTGASRNPAGLVSPRLDAGDSWLARFHAQAYRFAVQAYETACADAIVSRGLLRLAKDARDETRFANLLAAHRFSGQEAQILSPEATSLQAGTGIDRPALSLPQALSIRPSQAIARLLSGIPILAACAARLEVQDGQWRALDAQGVTLAQADTVVVATGARLPDLTSLDIIPTRGQISLAALEAPLSCAISWGGYAVPLDGQLLFGATHDAGDGADDIRIDDDARNRAQLAKGLQDVRLGATVSLHAGVRAATRDRLPICGELQPGLFVLGGLGSRGLTLSPILASTLAGHIGGAPSPLALQAETTMRPARFTGPGGFSGHTLANRTR